MGNRLHQGDRVIIMNTGLYDRMEGTISSIFGEVCMGEVVTVYEVLLIIGGESVTLKLCRDNLKLRG